MKTTLTVAEYQELRAALEQERGRLRESLGWLATAEQVLGQSQGDETSPGGAQADVASDVQEQSMDVSIERTKRDRLAEVEAALDRLNRDEYGVCARCGQPIGVERLRVVPWTRYCISCSRDLT